MAKKKGPIKTPENPKRAIPPTIAKKLNELGITDSWDEISQVLKKLSATDVTKAAPKKIVAELTPS